MRESDKKRYLRRVAAYECVWCGRQDERTLSGKVLCQVHAEKHYKSAGNCHRKPMTDVQRQAENEAKRKYRKAQHKAHICMDCGRVDAYTLNGRVCCAECLEKRAKHKRETRDHEQNRQNAKRYRDMWREAGRCTRCGKEKWQDGYKLCPTCRAYSIRRNKINSAGKLPRGEDGMCFCCRTEPVVQGKKLCAGCMEKRIAALRKAWDKRSEDHPWKQEWKIWRAQNGQNRRSQA